ncbi:MAG: hypothetical protein KF861_24540, partial [Planctomycetaceae bacterium]|nr:hypothetical protein [Planctomycetaceae bacterium]
GLRGQFPRSMSLPAGTGVTALRFEFDYGDSMATSLDGPLWVRLPVHFGRVTVLGLDLGSPPLSSWDTLPQLCLNLAGFDAGPAQRRTTQRSTQLSRTGISDLSTQLATAVDQYPRQEGDRVVSTTASSWRTMGWTIAYLLMIGPLDYLIVHRLLRRPQLTWVTFPLMVLATATLAGFTAQRNHPPGMTSNQVCLFDVDESSGGARTILWSSFVSPETRRYAVDAAFSPLHADSHPVANDQEPSSSFVSWTGIPENGFRGMYRAGGLDLARPRYRFASQMTAIEDVPVGIWSSYSTTSVQHSVLSDSQQFMSSNLEWSGGQLSGSMTNRLNIPIEDWFIAYDNLVYFPRDSGLRTDNLSFAPQRTVAIPDNGLGVRTARSFLTGVTNIRTKGHGSLHESDAAIRHAYDPLSRDFDRILRAISFYRASGGAEFTTLENDALHRLDLSPFLALSRAVFFGRIDQLPAELRVDGEAVDTAESAAYVRVLLPVRHRK